MSTLISSLRAPLRFILGDRDSAFYLFSDTILDDGVRSAILLNELKNYALTADQLSVTPALTDPNKFALLCFKTAKMFMDSNPDRYSFKSRAFSESIGGYREFLSTLEQKIYKLENGAMFSGWQSFHAFLSGISGVPLLEVFSDMEVSAPFTTVSLTTSGVTE